jgi:hypothetical protein
LLLTSERKNPDAGGVPCHDFDSYRVDDVDGLRGQEARSNIRQLEKGEVKGAIVFKPHIFPCS